jgi:hypothetical protein
MWLGGSDFRGVIEAPASYLGLEVPHEVVELGVEVRRCVPGGDGVRVLSSFT